MYERIDVVILAVARIFSFNPNLDLSRWNWSGVVASVKESNLLADAKLLATEMGLTLSIVFIAILVYIVLQRRALKQSVPVPVAGQESPIAAPTAPASGMLRERWNTIIQHMDSTRENDWKSAVMEADKLVDDVLRQAGFPGDTFGDRLTNIQPGALTSLDGLWWAHRIRNRVAHEMDYFLRYTEARQALSYYEAVLSELRMI